MKSLSTGWFRKKSENIPKSFDPDNAGEKKERVQGVLVITKTLFYFNPVIEFHTTFEMTAYPNNLAEK